MSISFPGGSSIDAILSRHGASRLVSMKQQLAQLQAQISTGKIADNYADLGAGRARSLDVRQKLSTIDAYSASITDTHPHEGPRADPHPHGEDRDRHGGVVELVGL